MSKKYFHDTPRVDKKTGRVVEIRNATANNLRNVSLDIPLHKLVAVVGKSGSGKSSLVYDVLYRASLGLPVQAEVGKLPRVFAVGQKLKAAPALSLGETGMKMLHAALKKTRTDDLLVVDEPAAGMGGEDMKTVLKVLRKAIDDGVSVLMVEHGRELIAAADHVIEFGPEAGARGGHVVFQGNIARFRKAKTLTAEGVFSCTPARDALVRPRHGRVVTLSGITKNNLKDFSAKIALGRLVCVTGRTGTGKTTLLTVVHGALFKGRSAWKLRQGFKKIEGKANVRRAYFIGQSVLSSVSTSTTATYLGVWDDIRAVYADLPESRRLGLGKSDFSFNTKKNSEGRIQKARYRNRTIHDVARATVDEAAELFGAFPPIKRKLRFLQEIGLGYLTLGQKSGSLSGGESQRVRLAKILSKKLGDRCLYILDTPSRGLHPSDVPPLLRVLQKIVDKNNTVLIADNREEIVARCDQVIHLPRKAG